MLSKLKTSLSRVRVRLGVLLFAFVAALPDILDALGVIDLKPLLSPFLGEDKTVRLLSVMAVVLAFTRPMIHMIPKDRD